MSPGVKSILGVSYAGSTSGYGFLSNLNLIYTSSLTLALNLISPSLVKINGCIDILVLLKPPQDSAPKDGWIYELFVTSNNVPAKGSLNITFLFDSCLNLNLQVKGKDPIIFIANSKYL